MKKRRKIRKNGMINNDNIKFFSDSLASRFICINGSVVTKKENLCKNDTIICGWSDSTLRHGSKDDEDRKRVVEERWRKRRKRNVRRPPIYHTIGDRRRPTSSRDMPKIYLRRRIESFFDRYSPPYFLNGHFLENGVDCVEKMIFQYFCVRKSMQTV